MDQKLPEQEVVRRYLLGTLLEPELSEIEQKLLSSEEFAQTAELIEDEIIEQYLDGELDERDKRAVETHFLRPPAHQDKLRFARLLRHHFAQKPAMEPAPDRVSPRPIPPARGLWTFGAAAAAVLLGASSIYLGWVNHDLKKKVAASQESQAMLQADLTREREYSASLQEKLHTLQTSFIVVLNLKPGVSRSSDASIPKTQIQTDTDLIKVDLILSYATKDSFRVTLRDVYRGKEIWSQTGLVATEAAPRSRLTFYVPTTAIKSGPYDLIVSSESKPGQSQTYPFDADVRR